MENLALNNINNSKSLFDNSLYVKEKIEKYLESNNLHALPNELFEPLIRKSTKQGYEIVDFLPEENFGNKGFYEFLMLKVKDLKSKKVFKYPMLINANSRERFGILYIPKIGNKFAFINEFRMGAGDYVLNFPRGFPEKIDNTLREFFEEVSEDFDYSKMKLEKLTESLENSSLSFNKVEFYLFDYKGDASTIKFGGSENSDIVLLTEEEVDKKIILGEIHDNFTLASWGYYKAKKDIENNKYSNILQSFINKFLKIFA